MVEGGTLLRCYTSERGIEGSNPSSSAPKSAGKLSAPVYTTGQSTNHDSKIPPAARAVKALRTEKAGHAAPPHEGEGS